MFDNQITKCFFVKHLSQKYFASVFKYLKVSLMFFKAFYANFKHDFGEGDAFWHSIK